MSVGSCCMYNRSKAKASSGNSEIDGNLLEISRDCLGLRLRKLDRIVTQIYEKRLAPHGISLAQFTLLTVIGRLKEPSPGQLGSFLHIEKSSLSRNLQLLIRRGLVSAPDARGQRIDRVGLSEAGRRKIQSALPDWRAAQKAASDLLGPRFFRQLRKAVDTLDCVRR